MGVVPTFGLINEYYSYRLYYISCVHHLYQWLSETVICNPEKSFSTAKAVNTIAAPFNDYLCEPIAMANIATLILQYIYASGLELSAAILSLYCVILAAKNNIWNWPVAMIGSLLYTKIFFEIGLYSDAVLNTIFLLFQAYGLWVWMRLGKLQKSGLTIAASNVGSKPISAQDDFLHNNPKKNQNSSISWASNTQIIGVLLAAILAYFPWVLFVQYKLTDIILYFGLHASTPQFIYLDAAMLFLSLAALFMQAQKWIQHWFLWILIDLIYVPMYMSTANYTTAILYVLYMPIAFMGYHLWQKEYIIDFQERNTND